MSPFGKLMTVTVLFFSSVIVFGTLSTPDQPRAVQPQSGAPAGAGLSHEELQGDADMTQEMSNPGANTAAAIHQTDSQLQRSERPAYVRALEDHQNEIQVMLAEPAP